MSGKVIFFFFLLPLILWVFLLRWSVIQGPCTPGNLHTHSQPSHTPDFFPTVLVTLFTCKYPEMKWVAFVVRAGAFPSTARYLPPHVALFSFLHPFLFDFHPPVLPSIYPPATLSLPSSPPLPRPLLLPMLEVVDACFTLEPEEAVPLIVKRGTIGPLVWLGPLIGNTKDESVQTAMRGRQQQWQNRGSKIYIYIYLYTNGERGNFTKRTVRESVDSRWL